MVDGVKTLVVAGKSMCKRHGAGAYHVSLVTDTEY